MVLNLSHRNFNSDFVELCSQLLFISWNLLSEVNGGQFGISFLPAVS